MAASDYRLCDVCGGKAFYDAHMAYEHGPGYAAQPFRVAGAEQTPDPVANQRSGLRLDYLGDWAVLCNACAKTHRTAILPREVPAAAPAQPAEAPPSSWDAWALQRASDIHAEMRRCHTLMPFQAVSVIQVALLDAMRFAAPPQPEARPVAWRVRIKARPGINPPGAWRYVDGPEQPAVRLPGACDFEAVYTAPPPSAPAPAQEQPAADAVALLKRCNDMLHEFWGRTGYPTNAEIALRDDLENWLAATGGKGGAQ